jgi:hypothetical protein
LMHEEARSEELIERPSERFSVTWTLLTFVGVSCSPLLRYY